MHPKFAGFVIELPDFRCLIRQGLGEYHDYMEAVKTVRTRKARVARMSGQQLKVLANKMVEAKSGKDKQRLRADIIRGFYGSSSSPK